MANSEQISYSTGPRRILIVDDSSLVRLYYRETLEKAGFATDQAINGIEAMEKVLARPFDLVIVDVNMPRMDGLSFLRRLRRATPQVATLPVLMITTEAISARRGRWAPISIWSSQFRRLSCCVTRRF
jgi:two-component system, chemotaxis family, chemotaxis protein CheY